MPFKENPLNIWTMTTGYDLCYLKHWLWMRRKEERRKFAEAEIVYFYPQSKWLSASVISRVLLMSAFCDHFILVPIGLVAEIARNITTAAAASAVIGLKRPKSRFMAPRIAQQSNSRWLAFGSPCGQIGWSTSFNTQHIDSAMTFIYIEWDPMFELAQSSNLHWWKPLIRKTIIQTEIGDRNANMHVFWKWQLKRTY